MVENSTLECYFDGILYLSKLELESNLAEFYFQSNIIYTLRVLFPARSSIGACIK